MLDFGMYDNLGRSPLEQVAYAIDDNLPELKSIVRLCSANNISPKKFSALSKAKPYLKQATEDDILIVDNRLDGVRNLAALGRSDIDTDSGNLAGFRILTSFCDDADVKAGLRILWSGYAIEGVLRQCERQRERGVNLHAFRKNDDNDLADCEQVIHDFRLERHRLFVGRKLEYVEGLFDEWQLSAEHRALFFGFPDASDSVWREIHEGTGSMDVELRCDLIHEIQLTLDAIYGENDPAGQAAWFDTPIDDLGNRTPKEFLGEGQVLALMQLARAMEGP
ncbi:hypothetical protein [uncultured Tateyamaria sp.]|uniref:hypothetical protein n=1 Tax=uncultured Tateyamaria sp. TaxID=455651 RepID=UPI00261DC3F2|nr:hypothetical protein [uncultured Tateyamaria sp.]